MSWKLYGEVLQWLGVFYFVGFSLLGILAIIAATRFQSIYTSTGQAGVFAVGEQSIGPLILFFLLISAGTWFHGHEISSNKDLTVLDKVVAVIIGLVLVTLSTPQLYQGFISIIPAIKG